MDAAQRVGSLLQLRRGPEARAEAARLVAQRPGDAEAMRLLAAACLLTGDADEAATWAARAAGAAPGDHRPLVVLSDARRAAGRIDEARAAARSAVALAPVDPDAARALAASLSRTDDHEAAWYAGHRLVALAPSDPGAWVNLGYTLHRRWPAHARAAYLTALRLDPASAIARQNLAALDSAASPFEAIDGFAAALAEDPTLHVARQNLTEIVNKWAWLLMLAVVLALQVLGRAGGGAAGPAVVAVLAVGLAVAVAAIWRLPRSVRRSLRTILLPGLTANRWAVRSFVLGLVTAFAGAAWLARAGVEAQLPGVVVGLGAMICIFSLVGLIVSVRDAKRRDRPRAELYRQR